MTLTAAIPSTIMGAATVGRARKAPDPLLWRRPKAASILVDGMAAHRACNPPQPQSKARFPITLSKGSDWGRGGLLASHWTHATANVGDAIGVSLQSFIYRSHTHRIRSQISTAKHNGNLADYVGYLQEAVKSAPEVWEFKIDLAKVMVEVPDLHQTPEQRAWHCSGIL